MSAVDCLTWARRFVTPTRHARHARSDSHRSTRWVSASVSAAVGALVATQRLQWKRNEALCSSSRNSVGEYVYVDSCPFWHGAENTIVCLAATVQVSAVVGGFFDPPSRGRSREDLVKL